MVDPIKRLRYLHDNTADAEDREALKKAIEALNSVKRNERFIGVKKELDKISTEDPEFVSKVEEATKTLTYPEHEWVPCNLRKIMESLNSDNEAYTEYRIPNSILDKPVLVLEDDGIGYGAFHSYAFTSYSTVDGLNIWI